MTISSSATTAAVTASSVMLAPENEFAMSAPNAGPPVTSVRRSSGSPSAADLPQRLDRVVEREPGEVGVQRHHRQCGFTVVGHLGAPLLLDGGEIGGVQPRAVVASDDDDRRDLVAAGELGAHVVGARGFGGVGHGNRGSLARVVPAEQRHERAGHGDTTNARTHDKRRDMPPIFQILNY